MNRPIYLLPPTIHRSTNWAWLNVLPLKRIPAGMAATVFKKFAGSKVDGLVDLLKSVKISKRLVDAEAFCERIGADNMAELNPKAEGLARALRLPLIKRKNLVNAIRLKAKEEKDAKEKDAKKEKDAAKDEV